MARSTDPQQRGILKRILGRPYNSNLRKNNAPVQTGGEVVPKFSPQAGVRARSRVAAPPLPGQNFPKSGDGTYTKYNTTTKQTVRYNADGSLYRKPRPAGRRYVPAGAGGRGTRVKQEK